MNNKIFNRIISSFTYRDLLLSIVFIKAILMVLVILWGGIGLSPDEAQYWTWSRSLDIGYYSKPPGIAWQIWFGTHFFGHTELGVRFVAIILSMFQAMAIYYLALQCKLATRTAFYCGVMMALCPMGMIGSLLAITDGGFLFFWTLASIVMVSALSKKEAPNTYLIAVMIIGGALFKWPMYAFWIFFFIFRWIYFSHQKWSEGILGVLVSLIGLIPSLWWSSLHDWATFRHVTTIVKGGNSVGFQSNFFEFLGSQILLLSPVLFGLLIFAYWFAFQKRSKLSFPLVFCGFTSGSILISLLILSCFQKVQGNWGLYIYPTAIIMVGWFACEESKKIQWLRGGIGLSVVLTSLIVLLPHFAMDPTLFKMNPFKHNMGWKELREVLSTNGYDSEKDFLIADKYQTTSELSFYGEGQKRAYFLNLQGARNNQFTYWPQLQDEQKGKVGYFVWVENAPHLQRQWKEKFEFYQNELRKFFEEVEFIGLTPLVHYEGEMLKGACLFKCKNCTGKYPEASRLY